jgi:O-antigen ligase
MSSMLQSKLRESLRTPLAVPRLFYFAGLALIGEVSFRPLSLTISDALFFAALVATGIELLRGPARATFQLPRPLVYGIAAFAVGGLISSVVSAHPLGSMLALGRFIYIVLIWFWLGTVLIGTLRHLYTAVALWSFSVAVVGLSAIVQLFWTKLPGMCALQYCNYGGDTRFIGRMAGFTQAPNDLGGMAAIVLIPVLTLTIRPGISVALRTVGSVFLLATVIGLIISGSVAAMAAAIIAVILWVLLSGVTRKQLAAVAVVAATIIVAVGLQSAVKAQSPLQRLEAVLAPKDPNASMNGRIRIDKATLELIRQSPVVGIGLDSKSADDKLATFGFRRGLGAHNFFLAAWLGGGVLALLGLLLIVGFILRLGYQTVRSTTNDPEYSRLAIALTIAFITYMVFGIVSPTLYLRYGWVSAALLIALANLRRLPGTVSAEPALPSAAVASKPA